MTPGLQRLLKTLTAWSHEDLSMVETIEDFLFELPLEAPNPSEPYVISTRAWDWRVVVFGLLTQLGPGAPEIYRRVAAIEEAQAQMRHEEDLTAAREALAALAEAIDAGHPDPEPFLSARRKRHLGANPHGMQEVWKMRHSSVQALRRVLPRAKLLELIPAYEAQAVAELLGSD